MRSPLGANAALMAAICATISVLAAARSVTPVISQRLVATGATLTGVRGARRELAAANATGDQIESADGLVRLVDGGRNSSAGWGRVEVRRSANSSEWGTVCAAYGLATETAYVVCKQLGLPYTGVEWWDGAGDATGTAPILLAGRSKLPKFGLGAAVECYGNETSILDCSYDNETRYCTHNEDVTLVCKDYTPEIVTVRGDLRLVDGGRNSTHTWGRLELQVNGTWSPVCDGATWLYDVVLACEELGLQSSAAAFGSFGTGRGPVLSTRCWGNETRLWDCWVGAYSGSSCTQHAGLVCAAYNPRIVAEGDGIRLVDGQNSSGTAWGRLEVQRGNRWYTVCPYSPSPAAAQAACRQLGLPQRVAVWLSALVVGSGNGLSVTSFPCDGEDGCYYSISNACTSRDDSGVVCSNAEVEGVVIEAVDTRLVNGSSVPGLAWGRLEVRGTAEDGSSTWGTVCADAYMSSGSIGVACRSLGLHYAWAVVISGGVGGYGRGYIMMDKVGCVGDEDSLLDCAYDTDTASCSHDMDVTLFCFNQNSA